MQLTRVGQCVTHLGMSVCDLPGYVRVWLTWVCQSVTYLGMSGSDLPGYVRVWFTWVCQCVAYLGMSGCDLPRYVSVWLTWVCQCVAYLGMSGCDLPRYVSVWLTWVCQCVTYLGMLGYASWHCLVPRSPWYTYTGCTSPPGHTRRNSRACICPATDNLEGVNVLKFKMEKHYQYDWLIVWCFTPDRQCLSHVVVTIPINDI